MGCFGWRKKREPTIDYGIEWVGGKTSAEPREAANDEKEER